MGKSKRFRRTFLLGTIIFFIAIIVFALATTFYIELRVQRTCKIATERYSGEKIQALITMVKDESGCSKQKARALWTLGQLGDKRALPFLRENYGDKTEDNLCIYEAQYAILKIEEKRFNLPGFLWRRLLDN